MSLPTQNGLEPLQPGATREAALAGLRRAFAAAGLDTPDLDARILLAEALGVDAAELALRPEEPLERAGSDRLRGYAARRLAREPVARILGLAEFWGLPFELSPDTLVPRPDTETVVEAALASLPDRRTPLRVLDLGTGSGCILVALLHELRTAHGVGVDRSRGALATACRNARRNAVQGRAGFLVGDWGAALVGGFDLIVSNPPYIATPVLAGLSPEVRQHDPPAALDGGADGLDAHRAILGDARRLLAPKGRLVVEIGFDQEQALRAAAPRSGLAVLRVASDLGGRPRAVVMRAAEA